MRKPLIIVEGFDPTQNSALGIGNESYNTFFNKITNQNRPLRDLIENGGYDLIYLNPRNGGDYIQNTAYLLQALIQRVNQVKAQNGSTEPNVILGFSMGGLVTRYALADMERNGQRHQTREYMTFDSPHQGANIPLGYQHMIKHLAGIRINNISLAQEAPALTAAVAMLNTPAARQLLRYQAEEQFSLYGAFQAEYRALGDPASDPGLPMRAVAVSNGSQVSAGQQFVSGPNISYMPEHLEMLRIRGNTRTLSNVAGITVGVDLLHLAIINTVLFAVGVRGNIEFIVNGFPDMRRERIYVGKINTKVLWFIKTYNESRSVTVSGFSPTDIAPGGYIDFAQNSPVNLNTIPLTRFGTTRFCFVPTVSALDIRSPDNSNIFYNIVANSVVATGKTPFQNVTGPDRTLPPPAEKNEFHTNFTDYNNRLLRAELLPSAGFTGNEALRFDGIDDVVRIPNTNSYVNELNGPNFSIEAFVRSERTAQSGGSSQTIFSSRQRVNGQLQGVLLTLFNGNNLLLQLQGLNYGAYQASTTLPDDGACHHVAVTRDANYQVRFYIDGQLASYSPTTSRSIYSSGALSLGADNPYESGYGEFFQGQIGELRVWNSTRSSAEIQQGSK